MSAIKITLAILGVLVVVQTALSFVRTRQWWVRMFDFPRPQIAAASLVLLGLFGLTNLGIEEASTWEWVLFGLLGLAVAAEARQILNDVAWSHTTHLFQRVAGVLDPRVGRGLYATFPVKNRFLRFPLDHIFHSNHFDLVSLRSLPECGSDHFPILVELALCHDSRKRPDAPELDERGEDEAIDAVEDARSQRRQETPGERRERKLADQ